MKILLFGQNGQVGWELQRSLAPLGEIVSLDSKSTSFCGDLTNLKGLTETIRAVKPNVIVNAAAYTAVDKAESDVETCRLMNSTAVGVLAEESKRLGARLIHYSTDYVFSGAGDKPYVETDATGPLSVYGQTKLEGENAISASGCSHLIFRTSWVYAARGNNFVKTILRLARERETLSIVADQFGAPTSAELIADVTAHALYHESGHEFGKGDGTYHLCASGVSNWHEFAQFIVQFSQDLLITKGEPRPFKTSVDKIAAIPTTAYPLPAKRPLNSRLNTVKLETAFGLSLPPWRKSVARVLTEIIEAAK